jgi:hypothetical protein
VLSEGEEEPDDRIGTDQSGRVLENAKEPSPGIKVDDHCYQKNQTLSIDIKKSLAWLSNITTVRKLYSKVK